MRRFSRCISLALVLVCYCAIPCAFAGELDSCASDLDDLRRAARDATDKATEAKDKEADLKSCRSDIYSYEYKIDRCNSKVSYLRSSISDLSNELDTVERRIKSARSSCGYEFASIAASGGQPQVRGSGDSLCDLYRSYRGKMAYANLVEICTQHMPADECKRCMAFKLGGK